MENDTIVLASYKIAQKRTEAVSAFFAGDDVKASELRIECREMEEQLRQLRNPVEVGGKF